MSRGRWRGRVELMEDASLRPSVEGLKLGPGVGGRVGEQGSASPRIGEAGLTEGVGGELGGHASLRLSGLEEPEDSSSGCRWKLLQSCWGNARGEEERGCFLDD